MKIKIKGYKSPHQTEEHTEKTLLSQWPGAWRGKGPCSMTQREKPEQVSWDLVSWV